MKIPRKPRRADRRAWGIRSPLPRERGWPDQGRWSDHRDGRSDDRGGL